MHKTLRYCAPAFVLACGVLLTPAYAQDAQDAATELSAPPPMVSGMPVMPPPLAIPPQEDPNVTQSLTIYAGEVRTLPISNIQRVAVGNGKLITTTVLESQIIILGEGAGETGLIIWLKNGKVRKFNVHVVLADLDTTQAQLRRLLLGMPGLRVERLGNYVIISGTASKGNLERLRPILQDNFKQVINMAGEEEVTMKKMVYLKMSLVEFKRSAFKNLGVQWATSISGPTAAFGLDLITSSKFTARQPDSVLSAALPLTGYSGGDSGAQPTVLNSLPARISSPKAYLGIIGGLTSTINLAVQNGDAYVLATPELSTRSGGEAKFLAGGQIPILIPASGLSPATVQYKDYGIKISIKPNADNDNNIMATITSEVSSIDPATTVNGNPGFLTRQSDSEINVKDGQTIVIGGLVDSDLSNQVDKFPWLGDLPIIGNLFKSTNFRNNRTDLVIFVTPVVVDPTSTINQERLDKARDIEEKFDGFLQKKEIVN